MSVKVGVLSSGALGRLAASFPGWRVSICASDLLDCSVVLADVDELSTLDEPQLQLGSQVELFWAKMEDGGPHVGPAVFLCPAAHSTPGGTAEVVRVFQGHGCQVCILSLEQIRLTAHLASCFSCLLDVAVLGIEEGAAGGGLPSGVARRLVSQTLIGTAVLLARTESSPAMLKDRVASPAGTTVAGLGVLEERAVRGSYIRAVELCAAEE
ncbi:MAG: hypothetical protein N3B14_06385 [Thermoleophilia bacterium]|nr:hypothetical protein [Thermoleophilia bacterium]